MAGLVLARYPRGLTVPARLELSGDHPWGRDADRLGEIRFRPFAVDWLDGRGDILLHFESQPEQGQVVLNSCLEREWGEPVEFPSPFRLEPDVPFRLLVEAREAGFHISVDDCELGVFPYRQPPEGIRAVHSSIFLWRLEDEHLARAPLGPTPNEPQSWWAVAERNPWRPKRLRSFRLFAVLCTWMEEDVIEATVANCLAQGCERVYLVDNASPDRTVERAVAAGATLARSFSTERYLEWEKNRQQQLVVDEVSEAEGDEHIWWLWLDADEFHHGPRGLTLREYLASLDRRFRAVGARFFNHLPSSEPAYEEGRHPLDFQPCCYEIPRPLCGLGHSNHPLQRWDRAGPRLVASDGAHYAECEELLVEPAEAVFFHHFPYRAPAVTRRRLERLFGRDDGVDRSTADRGSAHHMKLRLDSVDALYEGRRRDVRYFPVCAPGYVPETKRWDEWVPRADRAVARWY